MTLIALGLAVYGGVAAGIGARTGRLAVIESAQHAALGVFVLVTSCFALLTYAFLTFDFSVRYVATNTNLGTPFYYRITAVWGALEGSIILWAWMLTLYTIILIVRHRVGARELYPWALATMLGILAFFLLVMTVAAPPFQRQAPVPADGRGLNPLLEDTGMITHPVALYHGFTGFTVPYAFTQGSIGILFLGFLALVLLTALGLVAWRWETFRSEGELDSVVSRESAFLLNNVLLVAAAFTVFFGTVFPLLSEAVRGVKVSVGAPFFNQVNVPLFLGLIFLMGVGPLIAWRRASVESLKRNFLAPIAVGVAAAAVFRLLGVRPTLAVLTLALTVFVAATITVDVIRATRARVRTGERFPGALGSLLLRHNRRYGGFVVHLGILVVALGVTGSQAWSVQTETTLRRGEHTDLAGYRVRFDGLAASEESNHFKVTGSFTVANGRGAGTVLQPAKKFYPQEQSPIAYVDYRLGLREDVYLVLGDFARDGSQATVRLQVNRLVSWIWIGGLILTLGTVLALVPERRRPA